MALLGFGLARGLGAGYPDAGRRRRGQSAERAHARAVGYSGEARYFESGFTRMLYFHILGKEYSAARAATRAAQPANARATGYGAWPALSQAASAPWQLADG